MSDQLLTPSIFAVFAIGFAAIWFHNRHLVASAVWCASYSSAALAFGLEPVFINFPQTEVFRLVSDTGYIASALLLSVGLCLRYSQKIPTGILGVLFFTTLIPTYWYWIVVDNFSLRSEIISYGCAALILTGAITLYPKIKTGMDRLLFCIATAFGLHFAIVSLVTVYLFDEVLDLNNFADSIFLQVLNFTVSLIALSLAVVLFVGLGMEIIMSLKKETETDPMTKLLNRRAFETKANKAIAEVDDHIVLTLIVSDIDNFKQVNDTFGHSAGDEVIKAFAKTLKSASRPTDYVGRVGGEEFAILLPMAHVTMAKLVAQSARANFEKFRGSESLGDGSFTASFGIAELTRGESYKSLFSRADAALYDAKHGGKNCVKVSPYPTEAAANASIAACG